VSFDLANTSSGFELPNAYCVIISRRKKVFAIWVEHESSDPVIVTDLFRFSKAVHQKTNGM
jgi:hypothetical protein